MVMSGDIPTDDLEETIAKLRRVRTNRPQVRRLPSDKTDSSDGTTNEGSGSDSTRLAKDAAEFVGSSPASSVEGEPVTAADGGPSTEATGPIAASDVAKTVNANSAVAPEIQHPPLDFPASIVASAGSVPAASPTSVAPAVSQVTSVPSPTVRLVACTTCGHELDYVGAPCPECEARASKAAPKATGFAFCTGCGAPRNTSHKFCVSCGKRYVDPNDFQATTNEGSPSADRQRSASAIHCMSCSAVVPAGAKFCVSCGVPVASIGARTQTAPTVSASATASPVAATSRAWCTACGTPIPVGSGVCFACGKPAVTTPAERSQEASPSIPAIADEPLIRGLVVEAMNRSDSSTPTISAAASVAEQATKATTAILSGPSDLVTVKFAPADPPAPSPAKPLGPNALTTAPSREIGPPISGVATVVPGSGSSPSVSNLSGDSGASKPAVGPSPTPSAPTLPVADGVATAVPPPSPMAVALTEVASVSSVATSSTLLAVGGATLSALDGEVIAVADQVPPTLPRRNPVHTFALSVATAGLGYPLVWASLAWRDLLMSGRVKNVHPAVHAALLIVPVYGQFRAWQQLRAIAKLIETTFPARRTRPPFAAWMLGIALLVGASLQVQSFPVAAIAGVLVISFIVSYMQYTLNSCWKKLYGAQSYVSLSPIELSVMIIIGIPFWGLVVMGLTSASGA